MQAISGNPRARLHPVDPPSRACDHAATPLEEEFVQRAVEQAARTHQHRQSFLDMKRILDGDARALQLRRELHQWRLGQHLDEDADAIIIGGSDAGKRRLHPVEFDGFLIVRKPEP